MFSFAAIGIDHDHIFGQVDALVDAGCIFAAWYGDDGALSEKLAALYPAAKRVDDPHRILEDSSIKLVASAAIPGERASVGLTAMRHGKDFMSDKPGMVSLDELAEVRRVQAETKRIYSVLYSEHYRQRATMKACELVRAGAIGEIIHTVGLGPHRLRKPQRPGWFFERARYGGILADIGSHQVEQFLYMTGAADAEVVAARVANLANADRPGLQDFGEMHLRAGRASGTIRVDWFTPDGLPTWGDGRLFVLGTEGTIELRKYIDLAGRPGEDHLFLTDAKGVRYIDCKNVPLEYGAKLAQDVIDRTETAMTQAHCFKAMEVALKAQCLAESAGGWSA